jgi:cytoskeleton protein RodZ
MAGFGEELRLEREGRGISLEDLSAETKVQPRYFEALEQGEFHELPGGVFRRGIVRAYLSGLRLEETAWMSRFEASAAEHARRRGENSDADAEAWVTFATNVKRNRSEQRRTTGWRWLGVGALLLVVGSGGWALWVFELRRMLGR